jgi:L-lactate dehydrogenase complex protein LldE
LSGKDPPVRVALLITFFKDTLFPNVGIAATRLLERLGLTEEFPEAQTYRIIRIVRIALLAHCKQV